jgi:hypothetical protein
VDNLPALRSGIGQAGRYRENRERNLSWSDVCRYKEHSQEKTVGELKVEQSQHNVNVTLGRQAQGNPFAGKVFPCCICSANLDIRLSKRKKPYCICVRCGIQVFFRGKTGIRGLMEILSSRNLAHGTALDTVPAVILFNRILQMRSQKTELEEKRGLIMRDLDLENAIHAVDNKIKHAQGELKKLSQKSRPEKIE